PMVEERPQAESWAGGWGKLPPVLNLQELEAYRDKLKQQQAAVSKKVADLILEKQPAYVKELERVTSLQTGLQLATVICTNGRRHLNVAKEGFTQASLGLLANQRKRQLLVGLLKSLRTIKTLQRTDVRLSEMLEEEDYPGAIQLCLECQQAASTFRHYSCISELDSKLQDTLEQIEEQLDVALSKICKNFDVSHYTKVQQAYRLLGKTQTAMDQLHMHFTQAIHNTVFQVVLGYVELCAGNTDTKFQKLQYKDLCTHVTTDSYIPCLADLCKALWEVMLSYYRTMEWHEAHDSEDTTRVAGKILFVSRETLRSRKKSDYSLNKVNAPILTNTTLNVIRLVGKYMQMMSMLKPIAFDVVHFLSQLFDYYLYAVYTFFGRNDSLESTGLGLSSSRLRTTLNRIQESLIDLEVSTDPPGALTAGEERKEKVPSPHLSRLVVLTSGDTLYGLAERVVATESFAWHMHSRCTVVKGLISLLCSWEVIRWSVIALGWPLKVGTPRMPLDWTGQPGACRRCAEISGSPQPEGALSPLQGRALVIFQVGNMVCVSLKSRPGATNMENNPSQAARPVFSLVFPQPFKSTPSNTE
uniref:Vacuolar protein sorting-associated protein 54 N-terminal domain-containing protein n=1 Tax=Vombatus ursinus TaxID=29139 RepID=A0A4X2LU22_VOMUR